MSLTDLWRNMRDRLGPQKSVPANELIPRLRDSGAHKVVKPPDPDRPSSSITDVTPFATEALESTPAIPPPPWNEVFPAHHRAMVADLAKRGENPDNWEFTDGRDLGVSEKGHTVAFDLHKRDTSVAIRVELTLFKGQVASVRVR